MDDVIPPPEDLECPETSHTSSPDATRCDESGIVFEYEDLPNFNIEDVDLTNIDLTNLDIDLAIAHLDAITTQDQSQDDNDSGGSDTQPFYEPAPISEDYRFQFKQKCGYCYQPAGWRHNTRHFIQLRSGYRYACFACLCKRWNTKTKDDRLAPASGTREIIGLGNLGKLITTSPTCITHLPNAHDEHAKDHHRRLPRRRIVTKRQQPDKPPLHTLESKKSKTEPKPKSEPEESPPQIVHV